MVSSVLTGRADVGGEVAVEVVLSSQPKPWLRPTLLSASHWPLGAIIVTRITTAGDA